MLRIYNSLTKSKEIFQPIIPGSVSLYVCGLTVYDFCHIGHARSFIFFDTMIRFLKDRGYQVNYVRNITDIDDKIIARARQNQEDFSVLTNRFIQATREDMDRLGVMPPDREPRATEFIPEIIQMIQVLINKNYAYVGKSGDVYYDVRRFEKYGQLSHRILEDLRVGVRIEPTEDKKDPLDFALWKSAKPDEPSWDSSWGKGRPGWHIECSAMVTKCLANHIDIHGGGADLLFPHHENEIAQSEAATGEKFVNIWMHVGFLQINQEKMSKSLGNVVTVRDVLKKFHQEVLKYLMLSTHYRKPLNYTEEMMIQSQQSLERLYLALRDLSPKETEKNNDHELKNRFIEAMDDDFNTPKALSVLFDIAHEINRLKNFSIDRANNLGALLKRLGGILGILNEDPEVFLKVGDILSVVKKDPEMYLKRVAEIHPEKIESLIQERTIARRNKQWKEADHIREELAQMGVILEDMPNGETVWRIKKGG